MCFQEKKKKEENIMSENSHVSNTKRKVKQEKGESKNEGEKRRETSRSSSSSFVVSLFRMVRYLWCSHGVVFWQIELEFVDATFVGRSGGAYYHDVKVSGVLFAR